MGLTRWAATAALVLALGACGSDSDDTASDAEVSVTSTTQAVESTTTTEAEAEAEEAEMVEYQGSVAEEDGRFVEYPDGLRATFVGIESMPVTISNADPDHDTEVHVTIELANNGTDPVALPAGETMYLTEKLFYGANLFDAQSWAPLNVDAPTVMDLPQRLVPGTSVQFTSVFTLPGSELSTLAFEVCPDSRVYTPFVFTDLEALLA